ncbi:hypothetical protein V6N11_033693 [Hibiscus sabdariffa]
MRVVWERLVWCRCIEKEGCVELRLVFVTSKKDRGFVRDWKRDMPTGVGGILVTIWVIEIVGDTEMKVMENVTKKLRLDYFCH